MRPDSTHPEPRTHHEQVFYLPYRLRVAYAFFGDKPEVPKPKFPVFRTLDEFNDVDASKLQVLVKLVKHILSDDRIAQPTFHDDGRIDWPAPPEIAAGETRPRKKKILVHHKFVMMVDMIVSVRGVSSCSFTNGCSFNVGRRVHFGGRLSK